MKAGTKDAVDRELVADKAVAWVASTVEVAASIKDMAVEEAESDDDALLSVEVAGESSESKAVVVALSISEELAVIERDGKGTSAPGGVSEASSKISGVEEADSSGISAFEK